MRIPAIAAILLAALASCSALAGEDEEDPAPGKRRGWMSRHQDADGSWDPVKFGLHCEKPSACAGAGLPGDRVGATGLALLAFLGYGETHKTPLYGDVVRKTLAWYREHQDESGAFEPAKGDRFLLNHARATFALSELHGMTGSDFVRPTARRALHFLLSRRLKEGGWPASAEGKETDLETSTWAAMAIRSAVGGKLEAGRDPFGAYLAWLDAGTDRETGRFGKAPVAGEGDPHPPELPTAMACVSRMSMGLGRTDPVFRKGVAVLMTRPPAAAPEGRDLDSGYAYFGALACWEAGMDGSHFNATGESWKVWSGAMRKVAASMQRTEKEACTHGSWDPPAAPGSQGRVVSTAYGILCLIFDYR